MVIYIYLIFQQIIISCNLTGCIMTSMGHFDYMFGIGALELMFELPGIIKIFFKKGNGNK